jgi:hypothetical protein
MMAREGGALTAFDAKSEISFLARRDAKSATKSIGGVQAKPPLEQVSIVPQRQGLRWNQHSHLLRPLSCCHNLLTANPSKHKLTTIAVQIEPVQDPKRKPWSAAQGRESIADE